MLRLCSTTGGTFFLSFFLFLSFLTFTIDSANAQEKPQVTIQQSSQQVWQRQQVLITLEVKTDDPFSRLEVSDFNKKGMGIIPFKQQRTETKNVTHLSMTWAIFPFISGNQKFELPRIRYRPNRGRIQILDTQELSLQVRRLPIYVTPTMPVGKVSLKNSWNEGKLVTSNTLLEWKLTVNGEGIAKQTIPPLSRQIYTTKSLQILPLQRIHKTLKTTQGVNNQLNYKIPLKATRSGKINFPTVEVQYFEPTSGKLQKASLAPPFVIAVNKWSIGLITLLVLLVLATLLFLLVNHIKKFLKKSAQRKLALQSLAQAKSYQQVRNALNQLSWIQGWDDNLPLSKFLVLWEKKFGDSPKLVSAINALQEHRFSQEENVNINNISLLLLKNINKS